MLKIVYGFKKKKKKEKQRMTKKEKNCRYHEEKLINNWKVLICLLIIHSEWNKGCKMFLEDNFLSILI